MTVYCCSTVLVTGTITVGCPAFFGPRNHDRILLFDGLGDGTITVRVPLRSSVCGTMTVYCCSTVLVTGTITVRVPLRSSVRGTMTVYCCSTVLVTGTITVGCRSAFRS